MARLPRLVVPHHPHLLLQRGHDGLPVFREEQDCRHFLQWLREASRQFKVAIHAYVLLPDQWHLLATPDDATGLARMMQWVGRQYVPYFNARYQRHGTLWQGRFRAVVLEAGPYLLPAGLYLENLPVAARLSAAPDAYPWSSYRHHAGLAPDPLVTDHAAYWSLGNTPFEREAAYRDRMEQGIAASLAAAFAEATMKGWPMGCAGFKEGLAKQLGRRVEQATRGRPSRADAADKAVKSSVPN